MEVKCDRCCAIKEYQEKLNKEQLTIEELYFNTWANIVYKELECCKLYWGFAIGICRVIAKNESKVLNQIRCLYFNFYKYCFTSPSLLAPIIFKPVMYSQRFNSNLDNMEYDLKYDLRYHLDRCNVLKDKLHPRNLMETTLEQWRSLYRAPIRGIIVSATDLLDNIIDHIILRFIFC